MRKLVIAGVALIAVAAAGGAQAADMPLKAPPAAFAPSWTGFYLGLGVGFRSTRADGALTSETRVTPAGSTNVLAVCATVACALGEPLDGTTFRLAPYVGFNWQVGRQWVVGVEGDWGFGRQTTKFLGDQYPDLTTNISNVADDNFVARTTWDASARLRVGYLVAPWFLVYSTGGVAWLHVDTISSCGTTSGLCQAGLFSPAVIGHGATRTGWTIGGGAEAMLWGNWVARAEYRYADFGSVSYSDSRSCPSPCFFAGTSQTNIDQYDVRIRTHTATFGVAYKFGDPIGSDATVFPAVAAMPIKAPVKGPALVASPVWTGAYLGLGIGLRATRTDAVVTSATGIQAGAALNLIGCTGPCVVGEPMDGMAFRFAPYVGFNWQAGRQWVVGVEGDWGWSNRTTTLSGTNYPSTFFATAVANDSFAIKTSWDASARGRIGFLATPSVLVFATGGAAWLHVESTSTCNTETVIAFFIASPCTPGNFSPAVITHSTDRLGWTVGGGVESMLWDNWIARAEYRYADFGTISNSDTRSCTGACGIFGTSTTEVVNYDVKVRTHTATFGLAYKFDGGGPVVAKY